MTNRQAQLLSFLRERALAGDVAPSFEEMRLHLGVKSKSTIARIVGELEHRHLIHRLHGSNRAVTAANFDEYARGYRDGLAAAAQGRAA